jgi:hypothetical protein
MLRFFVSNFWGRIDNKLIDQLIHKNLPTGSSLGHASFSAYLVTVFSAYLVTVFSAYLVTVFSAYLVTVFSAYLVTVLSAYLMTVFSAYLARCGQQLAGKGIAVQ